MNNIAFPAFNKRALFMIYLTVLLYLPSTVRAQYCTPTYIPVAPWVGFDACGSSGTFPAGHLITNVTIGSINNTVSTTNCTEYDFTSQSTVVYDDGICQPTPMTVSVTGFCGVTVAVDLNNDFDFDDPGEIVIPNSYVAASPATYNLDLAIPPGTPTGPHRMRVYNAGANADNPTGGPCDVFSFGNFHDYTIIISNNPNPLIFQSNTDTTICNGQSLVYNGITYSSTQQISDTLQTVNGCDSFITINLTVLPPIVHNIDATICSGGTFAFGGEICDTSGIYQHILQTAAGCDSLVILTLTVLPPPVAQTINENICEGDSLSFAGVQLFSSGQYYDTLVTGTGCDSAITVLHLTVNPVPEIAVSFQPSGSRLCIGDEITLTAQGASSYQWYNLAGNLVANQAQFNYTLPGENNILFILGIDQSNCMGHDTIAIAAEACCQLDMPSVFSPNGDGLNDVFKPVFTGNPSSYFISIYNRWGQMVYTSYDIHSGWDGRVSNGQMADMGTYFWRMMSTCPNGLTIQRNGDVVIVR